MGAPKRIDDAANVTLKLPRSVKEAAKQWTTDHGTSVSQLVTDLLVEKMGEAVCVQVRLQPHIMDRLQNAAERKNTTPEGAIKKALNSYLYPNGQKRD